MRKAIYLLFVATFIFSCADEEKATSVESTKEPVTVENNDSDVESGSDSKIDMSDPDRQIQIGNPIDRTDKKNFQRGEFVYFADSAMFFPCDEDGKSVPVKMVKGYKLLEKAYMNMNGLKPQEKVYVELLGTFEMSQAVEGGHQELYLVVDKLVKMNVNMNCDS